MGTDASARLRLNKPERGGGVALEAIIKHLNKKCEVIKNGHGCRRMTETEAKASVSVNRTADPCAIHEKLILKDQKH